MRAVSKHTEVVRCLLVVPEQDRTRPSWRAMRGASVHGQPTWAQPDTACPPEASSYSDLDDDASVCAPYSRVRLQPHGLKDWSYPIVQTQVLGFLQSSCHALVVVRPQWRPGSPPISGEGWHRGTFAPATTDAQGAEELLALSIHKETALGT